MSAIPADNAQRAMGAASDRVAILDAGAQYGKVISISIDLFCFRHTSWIQFVTVSPGDR